MGEMVRQETTENQVKMEKGVRQDTTVNPVPKETTG
jgi:hypothetical protein